MPKRNEKRARQSECEMAADVAFLIAQSGRDISITLSTAPDPGHCVGTCGISYHFALTITPSFIQALSDSLATQIRKS